MPRTKTCPSCAEDVKAAAKVCRYCGHQFDIAAEKVATRKRSMGRGIFIGLAILGLVIFANSRDNAGGSSEQQVAEDDPSSESDATGTLLDDEEDSADTATAVSDEPSHPSSEIALTAEMSQSISDFIRRAGYHCPTAKMAFDRGTDAYGRVFRVYCGPTDRGGVYPDTFRFTMRDGGIPRVTTWD